MAEGEDGGEAVGVEVVEVDQVMVDEDIDRRLEVLSAELDRRRAHAKEVFAKLEAIRTKKFKPSPPIDVQQSTCEGCINPLMCIKCGVTGDRTIFRCMGCKLPVPKKLLSCEVCGNDILP